MFIKLRNIFSIFIFISSLIQFSYSYLNISSCTTINEGFLDTDRLVLMNDSILSSSTSSCIEITANNLIFDCQNNLVEGDGVAQYGINLNVADAFSNITVQNCQVSNWDSSNIRVRGQNNSISNILSFNSKEYGIDLSFGDSTIVYNLTSFNNNNSGVYFGSTSFLEFDLINSSYNNNSGFEAEWNARDTFINNSIFNNNLNSGFDYNTDWDNLVGFNLVAKNNGANGFYIVGGSGKNIDYFLEGITSQNNSIGIEIAYLKNSSFEDINSIENRDTGILIRNSDSVDFLDILSNLNNGFGLNSADSVYGLDLNSIETNYNNLSGIRIYDLQNSTFNDLTSRYNNDSGILILTASSSNNNYSNINIQNNLNHGIHSRFTDNNIYNNSIIKNNQNFDIFFESSSENNIFYANDLSNSSKINILANNHFNYSISGLGNIGNIWEDLSCLSTTTLSSYVICTNPSNYSLGSGVYDFAPLTQIIINNNQGSSSSSIFPSFGFISFLLLVLVLFFN